MKLRVIVPPHPLISHWLTMLRDASTPAPLYSTAFEELGRWLTYEALREWLPHREEEDITPQCKTTGKIIESSVPLISIPILNGGLDLWQGARKVLPNACLCLGGVPSCIETNAGLIIYVDQIGLGKKLFEVLNDIKKQKIEAKRIRVITALASNAGLQRIAESFPELTIFTSCIDPEVTENDEIIPGIGNPLTRLNTRTAGPI